MRSYTDGTKLCVEMSLVANALGLETLVPGMQGPRVKHLLDILGLFDFEAIYRGGTAVVDYVIGCEPYGGVFAVGYSDSKYQQSMLGWFPSKLGPGPFYVFHRPYHLIHIEAMRCIAEAVLDRDPLLQPVHGFKTNVCAYAKRDLRQGEQLDGIGGYACYGMIENWLQNQSGSGLPICLAEDVTVNSGHPQGPENPDDRHSLRSESLRFRDLWKSRRAIAPDVGENMKISVVILTYNGGAELRQAVEILQKQDVLADVEYVAVDSGSGDGTCEFLKTAGFHVYSIEKKDFSYGPTREYAFQCSTGDIIVTQSQDVIPMDRTYLRVLTDPIVKGETDVVQGTTLAPPEDDRLFLWDRKGVAYYTGEGREFMRKYGNIGLSCTSMAISRQAWQATGFAGTPYCTDKFIQRKLAEKGFRMVYSPGDVAYHGHSYNLRSLIKRCANEGLGWRIAARSIQSQRFCSTSQSVSSDTQRCG